jgi:hypothetical protein
MTGTLRPPEGGDDPPVFSDPLGDGPPVDLVPLATEICQRYMTEFTDEQPRHGPAGRVWCIHDNQHLLNWAVNAANEDGDMRDDVAWLASVLENRGFPMERLVRNLDIAAEAVFTTIPNSQGKSVADVLMDAAEYVRTYGSFREWRAV